MPHTKSSKRPLVLALAAACAIGIAGSAVAEPKKDRYILLLGSTPHFAAPVVGNEKGFCKEEGLNLDIKKFTSGGVAASSFLAGAGDFLDSGDWPAVRSWLLTKDKADPAVGLMNDAWYDDQAVVVAKKSLKTPKDWIGKTMGVWLGTTSEYFSALYLDKNGVDLEAVTYRNIKPAEMVIALDKGDIDGFTIWQPFGDKSVEVSGGKVHIMTTGRGYFTEHVVITTRKSMLDNDMDAATALIRCVKRGGDFVRSNPDESTKILVKFFKAPAKATMTMIKALHMDPTFNPAMVEHLDGLNKFMIAKGKSKHEVDWDVQFDTRGLMAVDPKFVIK